MKGRGARVYARSRKRREKKKEICAFSCGIEATSEDRKRCTLRCARRCEDSERSAAGLFREVGTTTWQVRTANAIATILPNIGTVTTKFVQRVSLLTRVESPQERFAITGSRRHLDLALRPTPPTCLDLPMARCFSHLASIRL